jgi:hypothetical protein
MHRLVALYGSTSALDRSESAATDEAIGDWHYWVAQGYCL